MWIRNLFKIKFYIRQNLYDRIFKENIYLLPPLASFFRKVKCETAIFFFLGARVQSKDHTMQGNREQNQWYQYESWGAGPVLWKLCAGFTKKEVCIFYLDCIFYHIFTEKLNSLESMWVANIYFQIQVTFLITYCMIIEHITVEF